VTKRKGTDDNPELADLFARLLLDRGN
jgi:hypothetical protein